MQEYRRHVEERKQLGIPPLPLDTDQVRRLCAWLAEGKATPPDGDEDLLSLLADRVPSGVDPAAKIKADFLARVARGDASAPGLAPAEAVRLLGTMQGGYNLPPLVEFLQNPALAGAAAKALSRCLLAGDAVEQVAALAKQGNAAARSLLESWARAEWFTTAPTLPSELKLVVYKVDGEVNTDDLSPAKQAPTRPDIPLHALSMGETRFPGGREEMEALRARAKDGDWCPVFVADTLGTGSSRKSATNSLVWVLGDDIPNTPNKRQGGVVLAQRIAPIFYNSFEDAGGLPLQVDVSKLATGQKVVVKLDSASGDGVLADAKGKQLAVFAFPPALADEWRAGGRINLIIGRKLSNRAAELAGLPAPDVFVVPPVPQPKPGLGYTLAQKMVGRACGKAGVLPGEQCEPTMSTVGSQDTTGPMTRDELNNLACLKFAAPVVLQSFCHTAAYPTDRDKIMQQTLPTFIQDHGGVALRPGDGIIHSWLNRMLVPDKVGTGGDSHTRFPLGISFAAGSGLVALAAAMGFMPVQMPESVLVKFSGTLPDGITLRDVVNAIPLFAIEAGMSDKFGQGGKNVFNGRVMEMEGISAMTVEEAFELACASAERSAAACTVAMDVEQVKDYVASNIELIASLWADDYQSADALARRKAELEAWLARPELMARDADAEYAATLDMDLSRITEPVLAFPNNPDLVGLLSERAGEPVDEVFLGSCMSNIGHFRAAASILSQPGAGVKVSRLWITPPTRMDRNLLVREGVMQVFEKIGARVEIPGCSLCMGNQARVEDNAVVFSTSTRNFDNRMGKGAQVYLGSAILGAITASLGKLPTVEQYFDMYRQAVAPQRETLAKPMYFHKMG